MAFDPRVSLPLHAAADESDLLARIYGGDAQALAQLYERHRDAVYRFAWLLTGTEAHAADVLQDTFVALLDRPTRFDPARGSVAAYLCGIARHLAYRRLPGRWVPLDADDAAVADESIGEQTVAELPHDALERAQALERLYAAIRRLPPGFREVLILVELQEMSYADAAAVAGIELGTVRSRLSRAKAKLAELLRSDAAIAQRG
jgi:RNA polymerase sigma-70 factor (ECF subfamily)